MSQHQSQSNEKSLVQFDYEKAVSNYLGTQSTFNPFFTEPLSPIPRSLFCGMFWMDLYKKRIVAVFIMLGGWVNPHREQQTIPQGQTSLPPKSFSTPTANGQSAPLVVCVTGFSLSTGEHSFVWSCVALCLSCVLCDLFLFEQENLTSCGRL